jgi:hypothetical protein
LLVDALPRESPPARVLCIRGGYGVLPVLSKVRWPASEVLSFDRDLLATRFTSRNADRLIGSGMVQAVSGWFFPEVIPVTTKFDLIAVELSPSAGMAVAMTELLAATARLKSGGVVLGVCLDKIWREWVDVRFRSRGSDARALAARDGFTVFSLRNPE